MRPIDRYLQVSTTQVVGATIGAGTFVPFPDVPELRSGVSIYGMEAYDATDQSVSPNGFVGLITAADTLLCTLILQEQSTQRVQYVPYRSLIARLNGGIWKEFTPFLCNWQSSGMYFTGAVAAASIFVGSVGVIFNKTQGGQVVQPPRPRVAPRPGARLTRGRR